MQHDFNIANQGFPATRSDINNALAALASTSSGTSEPSTTYANQFWYDTTNNLLKFRNEADSAWITLAYLDQSNNEWEIRSAVIQAVDSAGVIIKTDDGTARVTVADDGGVTFANDVVVSSGDLLVGTTSTTPAVSNDSNGTALQENGTAQFSASSTTTAIVNRKTTTGGILQLRQDGSIIGHLGTSSTSNSRMSIRGDNGSTGAGIYFGNNLLLPTDREGVVNDGNVDLGQSANRYKDIYLSGGAYIGGTGSANYLDDYEVGEFNATLAPPSGTVTISTAFNACTYVRVGNLVHISGEIRVAAVSSPSGTELTVGGLPFINANGSEHSSRLGGAIRSYDPTTTSNVVLAFRQIQNTSDFRISQDCSTITAGEEYNFSFSYRTP